MGNDQHYNETCINSNLSYIQLGCHNCNFILFADLSGSANFAVILETIFISLGREIRNSELSCLDYICDCPLDNVHITQ